MSASPAYVRAARRRERRAAKLYRQGLAVAEIARRLGVSPCSVLRYLKRVEAPLVNLPRSRRERALLLWPDRQPPYWELHKRYGCGEVVLGRKFCSGCGRWRQLVDYPHDSGARVGLPTSRCRACLRQAGRLRPIVRTAEQRELYREYQRIWSEGKRRREGARVTMANRRSVIDMVEGTRLPREPLIRVINGHNLTELAERAGIEQRTLGRIVSGESMHVRIDVADKIAVALGMPSALIWEEW